MRCAGTQSCVCGRGGGRPSVSVSGRLLGNVHHQLALVMLGATCCDLKVYLYLK